MIGDVTGKKLPAYSLGQPKCGDDDVCYLEMNINYGPGSWFFYIK